jgi:hypothetical protein
MSSTGEGSAVRHDAIHLLSGWVPVCGNYLTRLAENREVVEAEFGLLVTKEGQRFGIEQYGLLLILEE